MPVDHRDIVAQPLHLEGLGDARAHLPTVHVPPHRVHRRDDTQLGEDRWIAHVTGVQDLIYALERRVDLVAQQAVRVRDDADP